MLLQIVNYLENDLKISKDEIVFIDKENIDFDNIIDYKHLYDATKNYKHIFCDEIQNIKDWEKAILSLQNE
jgi:predicted AAA+ superfamily ATPase